MFDGNDEGSSRQRNVFGAPLVTCSDQPRTGFFRDGCCNTGPHDRGLHVVCSVVTDDFLRYSRSVGNDLSTPAPQYGFPGLKAGDRWCLCGPRWKQALDAGCAPKVVLAATHEAMLQIVPLDVLLAYAIDAN
jgi:uncharacterized protein (DUF2237 family)